MSKHKGLATCLTHLGWHRSCPHALCTHAGRGRQEPLGGVPVTYIQKHTD